ncbi:hypothetical protein [Stenotrophomonas sp. ATCM1_4]|uniref:hypothetical protein n=1 Tax=Stenotrophomonas sp. ATCM1_4 TaxID=2259330 RepID=UPI001404C877|nr:hypothetical protein [Stenotrophomonas sp. ATCM1_4]
MDTLRAVDERLERIERRLDALLAALADDAQDDEQVQLSLDGEPCGASRDQNRGLG